MAMKAVVFALFTTLAFATVGCAKKEEGTMEKVGKSLDEAAESTKDAANEAAEDIKEAIEE